MTNNISSKPYKIAVIGLGRHALAVTHHLIADPTKWLIAGVVDTSAVAYARFQSQFFEKRIACFATVSDVLAHDDMDVVYIASTAPSHVSIAKTVIEAGFAKSILIEKPISTQLQIADSLVQLIQNRNWPGKIFIDFNRRCSLLYSQVNEIAQSGELGTLCHVYYNRQMKISMKGSHYIDLANWFVRARATAVSALLGSTSDVDSRGAYFFDPEGCIDVTYDNGVMLHLDARGENANVGQGMTLQFEKGEIFVDVDESFASVRTGQGERKIVSDKVGPAYNWVENTFEASLSERPNFIPCTLKEAIGGLEILVAAHASNRLAGETVKFPLNAEQRLIDLRVA